ncbi:MAG: helix-hairpin-helix domain-containing protein [Clostridia bacterium]|nr:helix-hairpin-helix domain-containing protein [Clostridia bacterium]
MRRALAWTGVCLLLIIAGALLIANLKLDQPVSFHLSASKAALRQDERMDYAWPEGTIDINTGDAAELDMLRGVGPAIAQRIIEERGANGRFTYPEDLLSVNGIGQKTLDKLWEQIFLPKPDNQ